jgi:hypothetical protein
MRRAAVSIGLFLCAAGLFPYTLEIFGAFPLVISDAPEESVVYKAGAIGVGFSTLDNDKTFGVAVTGLIYTPFTAESTAGNGSEIAALFKAPVGFHLSIGCSVLPFETKIPGFFFPVTISLHTKMDNLRPNVHLDLGISTTLGAKFVRKRFSGFVRMEAFFDVYRLSIPEKGSAVTSGPNVFGLIPQAGFGITF